MNITIVGANGKIAKMLYPLLTKNGHHIRGIIRKKEQAEPLRNMNIEPIVADIEHETDITWAVGKMDAVLFAAGAGPGSGAERKWTVDRDGALKLIDACKANNIKRYIMISAMGLDKPRGSDVFRVYQKAKKEADEALKTSGLDYTIVKPGRLTDHPGSGKIIVGKNLDNGEIPREDVASVLAAVLETPKTARMEFDLLSGNIPIDQAISTFADS